MPAGRRHYLPNARQEHRPHRSARLGSPHHRPTSFPKCSWRTTWWRAWRRERTWEECVAVRRVGRNGVSRASQGGCGRILLLLTRLLCLESSLTEDSIPRIFSGAAQGLKRSNEASQQAHPFQLKTSPYSASSPARASSNPSSAHAATSTSWRYSRA